MDNPYPLNIVYLLYIVGEYVSGFDSIIQQFDKWYRFLVVHFSCLLRHFEKSENYYVYSTSCLNNKIQ